MDKYKIELTKSGKWTVKTRDYFWQRWRPYLCNNERVERDTFIDALRAVGFAWWKEVTIRVDSIDEF